MSSFAQALAVGGAVLLLVGGLGHLRRPRHFAAVLAAQRLVPRRWHRPLSGIVAVAEAGVGAAAIAGWLAGAGAVAGAWAWLPMAGVAVVYAAFGGYTAVLRVRRPGAPCGCLGGSAAVSWGAVARAWVFCAGAVAAAPGLGAGAVATDRLSVGGAAVLVALIAWVGPQIAGIARLTRADAGDRRG